MSPELLYPSQFGLKDSRPTKESDRYALGMVTYEVLSGKAPFAASMDFIVMRKVIEGERPERPEGVQGLWFTDDLWGILNQCWAALPKGRPSIEAVLECLEQVSKGWKPPSQQMSEDVEPDEDDWDLTAEVVPPV
jgi:serine/threonine protein kinase